MALSEADVREILGIIDAAPTGEFLLQTDGFSLHVLKGNGVVPSLGAASAPSPTTSAAPAGAPVAPAVAPAAPAQPQEPAAEPATDHLETIESPMLGTFYRAEAPGAAPFVEVGSVVEPDSIVCIIEVMKMMNSVPAGVAGRVVEICAKNSTLVEYGEPLFRIEPA